MADFADPVQNVARLQLREGMHVADFGAGSGFYTLAAARRVGHSGRVYAVEVQKELLDKLQAQALREHITTVQVIWGDLDEPTGTKLADASMDAVIVSNVLFQSEQKDILAGEAYRVLKSGGQVLVVDWSDSYSNLGPHPEAVVAEEAARSYFESAGFVFTESFKAGEHHYGLILKKQ